MFIFDYKCKKCGNIFEKMVRSSDSKPPCPECESDTEKQVCGTAFQVNGAGAYDSGKFKPK